MCWLAGRMPGQRSGLWQAHWAGCLRSLAQQQHMPGSAAWTPVESERSWTVKAVLALGLGPWPGRPNRRCPQVRPAPDWPEEVHAQYRAFEWVLYRLRRAYMDSDVQRPARDLLSAGAALLDVAGVCMAVQAAAGLLS